MIRGTTAQFKFKLPYSKDELEWITIKFWQPGNPNKSLPITKNKSNCDESDSHEICVSLLASETLKFSDKYKAKVQLRAQPLGGIVFGSKQQLITVYPMLDEIIGEDTVIEDVQTQDDWVIFDGGMVVDQ
jgi:hypothetical protein